MNYGVISVLILAVTCMVVMVAVTKGQSPSGPMITNYSEYSGRYENPDNLPVVCIDGLVYLIFNNSLSIKFDIKTMQPELCKK